MPTMWFQGWRIRHSKQPPLLFLRRVIAMYVASLVVFGAVRAALGSDRPAWSSGSAVAAGLIVMVFGLAEQLIVWKFVEQPLRCDGPSSLAGSFSTRFFLRLAFAMAPALFAFTFSFVSGWWWVYLFGLIPAGAGLARLAPTRAAVEREWRDLIDRGCDVNLLAALMAPPPST